jgi:hypothetical protein
LQFASAAGAGPRRIRFSWQIAGESGLKTAAIRKL